MNRIILDRGTISEKIIMCNTFDEHITSRQYARIICSVDVEPGTEFPDISDIKVGNYFSTVTQLTATDIEVPVIGEYNYISEITIISTEQKYEYVVTISKKVNTDE